jgi:hypothetical protein
MRRINAASLEHFGRESVLFLLCSFIVLLIQIQMPSLYFLAPDRSAQISEVAIIVFLIMLLAHCPFIYHRAIKTLNGCFSKRTFLALGVLSLLSVTLFLVIMLLFSFLYLHAALNAYNPSDSSFIEFSIWLLMAGVVVWSVCGMFSSILGFITSDVGKT